MSTSPSFRSRKLPLILILLIGVLSASAITFGDTFLLQGDAHEGLSSAALSHTQQIGSGTSVRAASVSTDKSDYKPGEIVQITGSGFAPNEPVTLQVVHIQPTTLQFSSLLSSESAYDHAGHEPWQVLVGADGSFTSTWLVQEDSLNQTLLLTADQPATAGHAAIHAETTFTDSSIETYDQCSNDDGDGYASGDTGCRWINGNLNKNNSTYREGEATVQRLAIYEFVPGSTHTVTLQYGTTKAGKHAYDFLTTWDWSEDWIALADRCQDLVGCTTAAETYFDIPQDSNVPDGFEPSAPGDRQMTMRGGTLTGVSAPGLVSGDYSGDSETAVTVSFTVANSGPMCATKGGTTTCGVALWFGAHIAKGDDWGPPGGASDIPGSPYHVSLDKLDGEAIGERDNQMQSDTVVPPPNLVISKTAANTPINAGDVASFTITVTNTGTGPANNVTMSDQLPAGIVWTDNSAACTISAGGLLSCSFGNLAAGASVSVTVSGTTDAADCGTLNNLATAQADNNAPVQDDASIVVNCPDIDVTKVADQGTVSAGTAIGFTITVTNNGPGSATGVTLSDTLPTNGGLSWSIDGGTGAASCSIAAGVLSCNFGTLANGATRTVHISSPTTSATCGTVNNIVTVAATNEAAANTTNNSASASVTVNCPDIRVQKTAANTPINAGDVASFTITIDNIGAGSATGVTLNDPLPAGVAWAITGGTGAASCVDPIVGNTLSCNFGTMAAGASFTVIVSGTTDAADCGTLNNTATGAATNEPSNVLGNNSASASIVVQCPDVRVVKTADNSPIGAGQTAAFTIVVSNIGSGNATNVTVNDTLPSGVNWAINPPVPGCSIAAGALSCSFANLAAGASIEIHISGLTDAADCGTLPNTATVGASNEPAGATGNNSSTASIVVLCGRLLIDKITFPAVDPSSFPFSGSYSFNLTDAGALFDSGPIAPGSYPVTEGTFAGWVLTNLACNDSNSTVASTTNLQTRTATINVEAGETVTCVFTNSKLPTLKVRKVIQGQSETFNFVIAGNPTNPPNTNVDLTPAADDEAETAAQTIALGDYSVTETPIPDGWLLTDASCVSDQPTNFVTDNTGLPGVTFTARYGDDIVCSFFDSEQGGATRTQGFWSTHTVLTNAIWNGTALPEGTSSITPVPVIGSADQYLCKPPVGDPPTGGTAITAIPAAGQNQVLGGFWSNIAKKSDNKKRNELDSTRMQFLQQYLAAVLNVHAFGTPIGTTTLAQARTAYCGNNAGAILAQKNLLAAYNEAGDNVEFTPGVNATAKLSREQANIPFWDTTFR
jgi:uncharacterized repeat protein (TIGR01451 family)